MIFNLYIPGWKFDVLAESPNRTMEMDHHNYSQNFLSKVDSLIIARDGHKTTLFDAPGYGNSNWFQALKYHGDGIVEQHGPAATAAKKK